jgi:MFS transporter, SHS family, lactate transporter
MQTIAPRFGWQVMFVVGALVAMGIVLVTLKAPESDAWRMQRKPSLETMYKTLLQHLGAFGYLLLLMTAMTSLSHGTQDLYPDFLKSVPWIAKATVLGMNASYGIPVLYNVAAIAGALMFGRLSEKIGRRYSIMAALVLCLVSIPAWAFGSTLLVLGSYFIQTGVQGAFGVIPAHLNELSPSAIRSLFPDLFTNWEFYSPRLCCHSKTSCNGTSAPPGRLPALRAASLSVCCLSSVSAQSNVDATSRLPRPWLPQWPYRDVESRHA